MTITFVVPFFVPLALSVCFSFLCCSALFVGPMPKHLQKCLFIHERKRIGRKGDIRDGIVTVCMQSIFSRCGCCFHWKEHMCTFSPSLPLFPMFPYRFIESQKFVHTRLFAARATERVSKSNTLAYELPNGNWALSTRTLLMLVAWCVHVCVLFFLLKSLVLYTYLTGFRYHAFWILCACLCAVFIFFTHSTPFFIMHESNVFFLNSFQYTLFIHGNKLLLKTYTTSLLSLIYPTCVFVFHFVTTFKKHSREKHAWIKGISRN